MRRFTEEQREEIVKDMEAKVSVKELVKKWDVSPAHLFYLKRRHLNGGKPVSKAALLERVQKLETEIAELRKAAEAPVIIAP